MKPFTAHLTTPTQPATSTASLKPLSKSIAHWLSLAGQTLKRWLFVDNAPQITPIMRRDGQTCWRVYDPQTHQLQWFETEEEVLSWLDCLRHR